MQCYFNELLEYLLAYMGLDSFSSYIIKNTEEYNFSNVFLCYCKYGKICMNLNDIKDIYLYRIICWNSGIYFS